MRYACELPSSNIKTKSQVSLCKCKHKEIGPNLQDHKYFTDNVKKSKLFDDNFLHFYWMLFSTSIFEESYFLQNKEFLKKCEELAKFNIDYLVILWNVSSVNT